MSISMDIGALHMWDAKYDIYEYEGWDGLGNPEHAQWGIKVGWAGAQRPKGTQWGHCL